MEKRIDREREKKNERASFPFLYWQQKSICIYFQFLCTTFKYVFVSVSALENIDVWIEIVSFFLLLIQYKISNMFVIFFSVLLKKKKQLLEFNLKANRINIFVATVFGSSIWDLFVTKERRNLAWTHTHNRREKKINKEKVFAQRIKNDKDRKRQRWKSGKKPRYRAEYENCKSMKQCMETSQKLVQII